MDMTYDCQLQQKKTLNWAQVVLIGNKNLFPNFYRPTLQKKKLLTFHELYLVFENTQTTQREQNNLCLNKKRLHRQLFNLCVESFTTYFCIHVPREQEILRPETYIWLERPVETLLFQNTNNQHFFVISIHDVKQTIKFKFRWL